MTTTASIICNREVRFIPRGWQHPRDERGRYLPLLPNGYAAANGLTEAEAWPEMPATTGPRPTPGARDRRLRDDHRGDTDLPRLP
jgi:hypothetical protein